MVSTHAAYAEGNPACYRDGLTPDGGTRAQSAAAVPDRAQTTGTAGQEIADQVIKRKAPRTPSNEVKMMNPPAPAHGARPARYASSCQRRPWGQRPKPSGNARQPWEARPAGTIRHRGAVQNGMRKGALAIGKGRSVGRNRRASGLHHAADDRE